VSASSPRRSLLARVRAALRSETSAAAASPPSPADAIGVGAADRRIIEPALPYTMTGVARLQALIDAVRYCERRGIPGAFVECGVWRGGSVLAMIGVLQELEVERDIYLFDTFEGMTEPTAADVSAKDGAALETWESAKRDERRAWEGLFDPELFNEEAVRETLLSTGYPEQRLHLVRGPVEETLPSRTPAALALLRLDTDWYESTRHELEHLYPRLADGGVLIVDDYGHWEGARRAVDEYFERQADPVLLNRIDYTGRLAIKH
jgi:O-methyltransferase